MRTFRAVVSHLRHRSEVDQSATHEDLGQKKIKRPS
jgi:hypothetical protein